MDNRRVVLWILLISGSALINCEQLDRDAVLDNLAVGLDYKWELNSSFEEFKSTFEQINSMIEKRMVEQYGPEMDRDALLNDPKTPDRVWNMAAGLTDVSPMPLRFVGLIDALKHNCTMMSYIIFHLDYKAMIGDEERTLGRDNWLKVTLLDGLKKHGETCIPDYLPRFKALPMDEECVTKINYLVNDEFLDKVFGSDRDETTLTKVSNTIGKLEAIVPYIYDRLIELTKGDDDGEIVQSAEWIKAKELEHINRPCYKYIDVLADILYPAQTDLILDQSKIKEINPTGDKDFIDAWFKFRVCSVVVIHDESLLDELVAQEHERRNKL